MRGFWLVGVLVAAMTWAQMKSATPAATSNVPSASSKAEDSGQASPATSVAPDTPVLTIKGLCTESASNSATHSPNPGCQTVITRAQFERLVEVMHAEKDSQTKLQLSTAYPQLLVMAREAERRGVDKEPRFQERLRFARVQILSQELTRKLREETAQVPEKDIADYYRTNSSDFEEVSLERIVVPNRAQKEAPGAEAAGKSPEDAMTAEAGLLRTRAAQGESFTKLQKEAYDFAGVSGDSEPNPKMDKMRRRGLPLTHAAVFDLKPGQVSPVISDATGHFIYKLDSREITPLDSVKQEISIVLRRQQMQNVIQAIQKPFTTDVNQTYFSPAKDED